MTEQYVEIAAIEHRASSVHMSLLGGAEITEIVRYVGEVRRLDDGEVTHTEQCRHYAGGIGGGQVTTPHRTPAEAIACARIVADDRCPGVLVREAQQPERNES